MFPDSRNNIESILLTKFNAKIEKVHRKSLYYLSNGITVWLLFSNRHSAGINKYQYIFKTTPELLFSQITNEINNTFLLLLCASEENVLVLPLVKFLRFILRHNLTSVEYNKIYIIEMNNNFILTCNGFSEDISNYFNCYPQIYNDIRKNTSAVSAGVLDLCGAQVGIKQSDINKIFVSLLKIEKQISKVFHIPRVETAQEVHPAKFQTAPVSGDSQEIVGHDKEDTLSIQSLSDVEKDAIIRVLRFTKGKKSYACELLKIGRSTLDRKMERYHINPNDYL